MKTTSPTLPIMPYKGLSYYSPEDAGVFAGRKSPVLECADILAEANTRIFVLHGTTGCGKSSFLRAGLIPYLENSGGGFTFLKDGEKALFIRCTDAPLSRLAEVLYEFISQPFSEALAASGLAERELKRLTYGATNAGEFRSMVGNNPKKGMEIVTEIAKRLSRTLVLIVDQAEEVMTLKGTNAADRANFFEFLAAFSRLSIDLKLLVALRTEFHGRFMAMCTASEVEERRIRAYLLPSLSNDQLLESIMRPTLRTHIEPYGVPYDTYRFSFEDGLPKRIVEDLDRIKEEAGSLDGGTLPVLQIVCERLYKQTCARGADEKTWTITSADYEEMQRKSVADAIFVGDPIVGQIDAYLEDALRKACASGPDGRPCRHEQIPRELEIWRSLLSMLVKRQADGTAVTEIVAAKELKEKAESLKARLNFEKTMAFLAHPDQRIVRLTRVFNRDVNGFIDCYSLGHDALGLALLKWKVAHEKVKAEARRRGRFMKTQGIVHAIAGAVFLAFFLRDWSFLSLPASQGFVSERLVWLVYGLLFATSGTLFLIGKDPGQFIPGFKIFKKISERLFRRDSERPA